MISWFKRLFKQKPKQQFWDLVFKSPEELSDWMGKNLRYVPEKENANYWQTPQETFDLKSGDCEDFALFARNFIGGDLIGVYSDGRAHCVCVAKIGDVKHVFDLCSYKRYERTPLKEIFSSLIPDWEYYGILRRGHNGEVIISNKFTRPSCMRRDGQ